jgi:hypothetical protein
MNSIRSGTGQIYWDVPFVITAIVIAATLKGHGYSLDI